MIEGDEVIQRAPGPRRDARQDWQQQCDGRNAQAHAAEVVHRKKTIYAGLSMIQLEHLTPVVVLKPVVISLLCYVEGRRQSHGFQAQGLGERSSAIFIRHIDRMNEIVYCDSYMPGTAPLMTTYQ